MRNGKFAKKGAMSKTLVLVLSLILIIGCVTGGTLAWLLDTSAPVTNTFTESDIGVTLEETTTDYKMVPGWTIDKDPVVIVEGGSEDCWVFLKVDAPSVSVTGENDMPMVYSVGDYIAYKIDEHNWTQGDGTDIPSNVYYCKANDITADRKIKVLGPGSVKINGVTYEWSNNQVLTLPTVTKEMMDVITEDTYPTLTFTAYASQMYKDNTTPFSAAEAWKNVSGEAIPTPDPETP